MASFHLIHQLWSGRGYYFCYPVPAPRFLGPVLCRRSFLLRLASLARWHYNATRSARTLSHLHLAREVSEEKPRHETSHFDRRADSLRSVNRFSAGLGPRDARKISKTSRVGHRQARWPLGRNICRLSRVEEQD